MKVEISGRVIQEGNPSFVIAEAGSNFDGQYDLAIRLIDIAVDARADAVKFQTFRGESIYMPGSPLTSNLAGKTGFSDLRDLLSSLAMPREWLPELAKYAERKGIVFMSTPFDLEAVEVLKPLVPAYKIAAFELVHIPLLRAVGKTGKPVILSTGMANLADVERAIDVIRETGNDEIVLLHTVSNYPADPADLNLRAMVNLGRAFQLPFGLSDHTLKNYHVFAAVAMGASVIEKHYTYNRKASGPDHPYALDPAGLAELVEGIRSVESSLGDGIKRMRPSEAENREKASRSLFFARDMEPGEVIREEDLVVNRPGTGLHPKYFEVVVGMKIRENVSKFAPVEWSKL
jgi:sialic acid synthase SpsE